MNTNRKKAASSRMWISGFTISRRISSFLGLSATNLLESSAEIGNVRYGQKRNLYATAGYTITLMETRNNLLTLIPSFLVKSNLANAQVDVNEGWNTTTGFGRVHPGVIRMPVAFMAGHQRERIQDWGVVRLHNRQIGRSFQRQCGDICGVLHPSHSKGKTEKPLQYQVLVGRSQMDHWWGSTFSPPYWRGRACHVHEKFETWSGMIC